MGELTPVGGFEVLAGDTVQIQNMGLIRVSPPQTPVMHPVSIQFYNFFVPNRILDRADGIFKWEDFITGGEDGLYTTPPHRFTDQNVTKGSVIEAFGITPGASRDYNSFLPRGYATIFNEYFRDQQVQAPVETDFFSGTGPYLKVAWERDYFTQCRENDQLGPLVTLPLGVNAPVTTDQEIGSDLSVQSTVTGEAQQMLVDGTTELRLDGQTPTGPSASLYADLSAAGAININDLREAFALQRYQEARNLYGARFTEYLKYLGISSSDGRLQRPELISSGKSTINFSEVLNTASDHQGGPSEFPLGELGGHGIAGIKSRRARYFCEEHGHVISLLSVRPKTMYLTTQHRQFDRFTKEDYWQKELQAIGMEEVLNSELDIDHSEPQGVFGFNNRYESFKRLPSRISGDFRDTLDSWHLGRTAEDLGADPSLNPDFIECDPTDRIYADTSGSDKLWCTIKHRIAVRSMLRKSTQNFIL